MDFFKIRERLSGKGRGEERTETLDIFPDFVSTRSSDLMIRGRSFYAVWDQEKNLWSMDEYDIQRMVDKELYEYVSEHYPDFPNVTIKTFASFESGVLTKYRKWLTSLPDNSKQLDNKLTFADTVVKKHDYISKRLPYILQQGSFDAYEELMSVLYSSEERQKLEWAVGSIISGDSRNIQKFIVLYGEAGSGKSTFLNIVQKLFEGYYAMFEAKALVSNNNAFSTEVFRSNPLVAIQHDGDLSRIEDNSKLNSIISHEEMTMNEKYKQSYTARTNCFLFMGTNQPVKITNSKSGIIRRLIDVHPSGVRVPQAKYNQLVEQVDFELGAIAHHCLEVYQRMGRGYYSAYRPQDMILQTNVFFNFVRDNYLIFKNQDMTTLSQAYSLYKEFCEESLNQYKATKQVFREELKSYFGTYFEVTRIDGKQTRDVYRGFLADKIDGSQIEKTQSQEPKLDLSSVKSIFDKEYKSAPAQYANSEEIPSLRWSDVNTKLSDLNTTRLHYVKIEKNHIVVDFDLKDGDGNKSKEKNLEAAARWPLTYAEFSKSGAGVHLHYIYDGDATKLAPVFEDGIEIKTFKGNASLRRKLTFCNQETINHISSGLPLKGDKMIQVSSIQSETGLRRLIMRTLNKEIHSATKPSVDFIYKILEDAYKGGLRYDVNDLRNKILAFAMNSTNNSEYCVQLVNAMKFVSEETHESVDIPEGEMVFFDVEVFPNLFLVVYKMAGADKQCIRLVNPTSLEVEQLFKFKLVGFNCRRYDNHILYGRYLGYSNKQLYELSQKIINGENKNAGLFGEAYNISYTDVYDFCKVKQSLKKWEIDLGIAHVELGYRWDEDIPEEKWDEVGSYCENDVRATEAVFNKRQGDFLARQILADLADGSVNDTTNQLTTRLIFGKEKHPKLVYTDLATGVQS